MRQAKLGTTVLDNWPYRQIDAMIPVSYFTESAVPPRTMPYRRKSWLTYNVLNPLEVGVHIILHAVLLIVWAAVMAVAFPILSRLIEHDWEAANPTAEPSSSKQ